MNYAKDVRIKEIFGNIAGVVIKRIIFIYRNSLNEKKGVLFYSNN